MASLIKLSEEAILYMWPEDLELTEACMFSILRYTYQPTFMVYSHKQMLASLHFVCMHVLMFCAMARVLVAGCARMCGLLACACVVTHSWQALQCACVCAHNNCVSKIVTYVVLASPVHWSQGMCCHCVCVSCSESKQVGWI